MGSLRAEKDQVTSQEKVKGGGRGTGIYSPPTLTQDLSNYGNFPTSTRGVDLHI